MTRPLKPSATWGRCMPGPDAKGGIVRASNDASCDDTRDFMSDEYVALRTILSARRKAGLTQAEVARRMGTTASAVSRLEAALSRRGHSPTFATLRKYAAACGKRLVISLA